MKTSFIKLSLLVKLILLVVDLSASDDRTLLGNIDSDVNDEVIFFNRSVSGSAIRAIDLVTGNNDSWIANDIKFHKFMQEEDFAGIGDVNGDGRDDLILVDYTENVGATALVVDLIDGSTISQISSSHFNGWNDEEDKVFISDVNKNGRQDLILINMSGVGGFLRVVDLQTGMSTKTIYYSQVTPGLNGWLDAGDKMFIGNVGGGSSQDLVLINTSYSSGAIRAIDIMTNTTVKWINHGSFGGLMDATDRMLFGDVNGDGFDDLVFVNGNYEDSDNPMLMTFSIIDEVPILSLVDRVEYYKDGFFRGWVDFCDKLLLVDTDNDGRKELAFINISKSAEAIRVIDLFEDGHNTSYIHNSKLYANGWFDYGDMLFDASFEGTQGITLINCSMNSGFIRSIDLRDGSNILWQGHSEVFPSMNGWLDGVNHYSILCNSGQNFNDREITFDSIHMANGNFLKENRPFDKQLFVRDELNHCFVAISGYIQNVNRLKFKVELSNYNEDGVVVKESKFYFANVDSNGHFFIEIPIESGFITYAFSYYLDDKEINIANDVVCGDVFVISGQSNAEAIPSNTNDIDEVNQLFGYDGYQDNFYGLFLRTVRYGGVIEGVSNWGYSNVSYYGYKLGVWGLKMQYEITKANKVPTCVINGAVGGSSVREHIPLLSDPFYSDNNEYLFGVLNLKVNYAGYSEFCKAVIFYNGESEVDMGTDFNEEFEPLFHAVKENFPSSQVFITQISSYDNASIGNILSVSEDQRISGDYFDLKVMSSNGIGDKDPDTGQHIHFTAESYVELGRRYSNLLNFELYRSNIYTKLNFYPPDINTVYRENNSLVLEFDQMLDQSLSDDLNTVYRVIKFNDNYGSYDCNDIYIDGKKLVIMFNSDVFQHLNTISYAGKLPPHEYDLKCYLRNSSGVAAYTFNKFPIQHKVEKSSSILEVVSISNNESSQSIQSIQVYPNPVVNALNIKINELSLNEKIIVEILSLDGNLIDTRTCFNGALLSTVNINPGSYMLIINHEGNKWIEKFIKF